METLVAPLLPLYERERRAGRAVALAAVVHTSGSTYRKPGALMLIAAGMELMEVSLSIRSLRLELRDVVPEAPRRQR